MKVGYAQFNTKDQAVALQVDALKKAGCTKVHTEVMSGARSDARLMRNGYNVKNICDLLNSNPREISAFIRGHLPPERMQQLSGQLLAVGVSL